MLMLFAIQVDRRFLQLFSLVEGPFFQFFFLSICICASSFVSGFGSSRQMESQAADFLVLECLVLIIPLVLLCLCLILRTVHSELLILG